MNKVKKDEGIKDIRDMDYSSLYILYFQNVKKFFTDVFKYHYEVQCIEVSTKFKI